MIFQYNFLCIYFWYVYFEFSHNMARSLNIRANDNWQTTVLFICFCYVKTSKEHIHEEWVAFQIVENLQGLFMTQFKKNHWIRFL